MRQEALDLEGKVELARMLLQLGFKTEALAEFLTAAEMYAERKNNEAALELYQKVLEIDPANKTAENKIYQIKPRSAKDIASVISQMGIGEEKKEETATEETVSEEPVTHVSETADVEPKPEPEPETTAVEEGEVVDAAPQVDRIAREVFEGLEARPEEVNLAAIGIEEFLAAMVPLLKNTPEELVERRKLTDFFSEEGLWLEAFFEARAEYRTKPTVERLYKLISLINQSGEQDILLTFLLTESFAKRKKEVEQEILQLLIATFEGMGRVQEAEKIKKRLKNLRGEELSSKRKDLQALKAELEGSKGKEGTAETPDQGA
ncbi:hypothetical protein JXM67_08610 [candidate division WOR-3 bacterium]|nr:hypothetical protein [candidate division WOR-3 bacterium]